MSTQYRILNDEISAAIKQIMPLPEEPVHNGVRSSERQI